MSFLHAVIDSTSLEPAVSMKASSRSLCNVKSVTWWACLFRVRCVAFRNESVVPEDATSACVRACVYIYRISTLYNRLYNIYTVYCAKMVGDNLKGENK